MHALPSPPETAPRMAPLARLPVFLKLDGKRAVVAGDTPAAIWKAELLSAAGASVEVYAENPSAQLCALMYAPPRGPVTVHGRIWAPDDLNNAAIAIGDFDEQEAARFVAAARDAGAQVNIIDKPAFCDFAFGAIVNRSPLVIGISTDGAAPVFAQAVRSKLESLIPRGFARWAEAARDWRARVQALGVSFRVRRQFWETFAARAFARPNHAPGQTDFDTALAVTHDSTGGAVVFITTAGDPELLTLRAVRALQSADAIVFDRDVGTAVLDFARREARKIMIGADDESEEMTVALAKSGRRVVRLVRGEPDVSACRAAGVSVEVVPSVFVTRDQQSGIRDQEKLLMLRS